ncbi:glycosyltransferase family 9 protein [Sulfurimonas sp. HSL-1656]|uniref:glycosyltransferase family 9 protein n=1 Tax=Thiomicrolovo subterrani TaxID=3131934 RepID=UPI0031F97220
MHFPPFAWNGFREPFKFFTAPTAGRVTQAYRPADGKQRHSVSQAKNIVVFLQNRDFFGAQICHIPLLEALRKVYPGRKIHLVSKHKISNLLKELGLADEVILESGKLELASRYFALAPEITLNLRRQSGFVNTLVGLGSVQTKIGFASPISKKLFTRTRTHETGIYRAQNYLRLLDRKMEEAHFTEGNEILIMPGAGGEHKIWPLANYLEVARVLSARHPVLKVAFVLGAKEKGMRQAIEQSGFAVYDNLDIRTLVGTVKRAKCVIANDCGPSHIAQIYKKRSVILFTDETYSARGTINEWFHQHDRAVALIGEAGAPIDTISVTEVVANVEQLLCC